jgi:hypothetical protein
LNLAGRRKGSTEEEQPGMPRCKQVLWNSSEDDLSEGRASGDEHTQLTETCYVGNG